MRERKFNVCLKKAQLEELNLQFGALSISKRDLIQSLDHLPHMEFS